MSYDFLAPKGHDYFRQMLIPKTQNGRFFAP